MKILPNYVKKGDSVTARDQNNVTQALRNTSYSPSFGPAILAGTAQKRGTLFECVNVGLNSNGNLACTLVPATILNGTDNFSIYYKLPDNTYEPLEATPIIELPLDPADGSSYWLGVDTLTYKLAWYDSEDYPSTVFYIGRFTFTVVDGDINNVQYTQLQSSIVIQDTNNPFKVTPWNDSPTYDPSPSAPNSCRATIANGYVWTLDTKSVTENALIKRRVKYEDVYLDDEPSPLIEDLDDGDVIYVKITTDPTGVVIDDPEIYVGAADEPSIHFQPDPVLTSGEYYYPIAKIKLLEFDGADGTYYQFVAEQIMSGDINIQADLVTIKSVGGEREVFKTYDEETSEYNFRTLKQLTGESGGVEIIVPEGETEQDTIDFRYIKQRDSQPQVEVNLQGDAIEIKGNGVDISLGNVTRFSVSVLDGLVTSFLKEGPDGKNLNLAIEQLSYNNAGEIYGSPFVMATLYFRDGLYVGTIDPEDDPDPLMTLTVSWLVNAA